MGERSIIAVKCPECGFQDDDVYFAPTCGFTDWTCPKCDHVADLMRGTRVEDYSSAGAMEALCGAVKEKA